MPMISKAVCQELQLATCDGPTVRLRENSDTALSDKVHVVLARSGATWSWSLRVYVFADLYPHGQAAEVIQRIVARQTAVRPDRGMVSCPASIAELLWSELPQDSGLLGLEPSAGHGALAAEGARLGYSVDCYEVEGHRAADITRAGIARSVSVADFLTVEPRPEYHAVAMYPPHRVDLAAAHVLHAFKFLRPGGVLGALVSCGIENGARPATRRFQELLGSNGHYTQVLDEVDGGGDDFLLLSPGGNPVRAQIVYLYADE
ncbi:SAM-dependent methyltransferase [Streptomyces sp. CA-146814]|uniref:SAM-dependent methyltransferase n=1 Tax=Streptomyces sp. CA-146814 TaxID=3240053 RepID=UPI003D918623